MPTLRLPRFAFLVLGLGACTQGLGSTEQQAGGGAGSAADAGAGAGGGVRGAIFTTLDDGSRVNANIYPSKDDVYLDGGPGMNAPSGAAALAEGDYYFQVTDPSGHHVLSTDDIACRKIHVNAAGFIDTAYAGPGGCQHLTGVDQDYGAAGAITVQLMPYLDTPNNGGVYKAWVTPVADYNGSFKHNKSKTDNFKVLASMVPPPGPACGDGNLDSGEQCDDGNLVDGDGCAANCTIETTPPPPPGSCCGDGVVDSGEQCDDGNTTAGDGCSATCTLETPPPPPPAPCCGNGVVETGEACDDGNTTAGDGCSATCTIETPVCGNGIVEDGEACDDGNVVSEDGCSSTCQVEGGVTCDYVEHTEAPTLMLY